MSPSFSCDASTVARPHGVSPMTCVPSPDQATCQACRRGTDTRDLICLAGCVETAYSIRALQHHHEREGYSGGLCRQGGLDMSTEIRFDARAIDGAEVPRGISILGGRTYLNVVMSVQISTPNRRPTSLARFSA
jgi:hypothetical protein